MLPQITVNCTSVSRISVRANSSISPAPPPPAVIKQRMGRFVGYFRGPRFRAALQNCPRVGKPMVISFSSGMPSSTERSKASLVGQMILATRTSHQAEWMFTRSASRHTTGMFSPLRSSASMTEPTNMGCTLRIRSGCVART